MIHQRLSRNEYETHAKHILEMTQIQLFNKFKDEHSELNLSINTFVQHKPWYVRHIIVCDTSSCCYHVEFELYFDTFLKFGKMFYPNSPIPSIIHVFIFKR